MLLAAAEKHLRGELARRAMALAEGDDSALSLVAEPGSPPRLAWHGHVIATLARGPTLVQPAIQLDPSLRRLEPAQVQAMADRLQRFVASQLARHAAPLAAMGEAAGDLFTPPRVRALLAALTDNSGTIGRAAVEEQLNALTADERPQLRKLGLTIGSLDIFHPQLLKPEAVRWRAALMPQPRLALGVAQSVFHQSRYDKALYWTCLIQPTRDQRVVLPRSHRVALLIAAVLLISRCR